MPKINFDKLNFTQLTPTPMHLQLADSSVCYPEGIAEDVPVKVRDYFIPVDFVVLDMEITKETPLILGCPFLSTTGATVDVEAGEIRFNINGKEEKFPFQPKEQPSTVKACTADMPRKDPPHQDSLITFMKKFVQHKALNNDSSRY